MDINTVQNFIVEEFDSYWIDTQIEHANLTIDKTSLDEWVRLTIVHGPAKRVNMKLGALRTGSVYVQVFTKSDVGQGRAIELATKAGEFIQALQLTGLNMSPYELMVLANKATAGLTTTETSWFQVNSITDFTFVD